MHVHTMKFVTKSQNLNILPRRWVLTNVAKWDFVKTSVSWISGKDIMDGCFILNYGYEAPLPWPQVSICDYLKDLLYVKCTY